MNLIWLCTGCTPGCDDCRPVKSFYFQSEVVPEGWRCPVCHCGVNPSLDTCPCNKTTATVTTTEFAEDHIIPGTTTS